ncbi:KTSC domain-containing protein [Candidatus Parcubacteria bacterium]|nr:KTSC domain-containing protein [Candidatus Parcubacteria bacterium]
MEMIPVSSSNIDSIGYDADTETLRMKFLSGTIYEYRNVPQIAYDGLTRASSHGSYFNREIRNAYTYERIG